MIDAFILIAKFSLGGCLILLDLTLILVYLKVDEWTKKEVINFFRAVWVAIPPACLYLATLYFWRNGNVALGIFEHFLFGLWVWLRAVSYGKDKIQ